LLRATRASTALLCTLVLVACAASARAEAPAPQPMVEWVVPALRTNKPQTPEQGEEGRRSGRKLPPPEVLQPALDPDLPAYRSSRKKLSGTFKGGASDVLTVIATRWFEAFRKYHPEVKLSIAPPYAGSVGAQELVKENLDFVFVSRELKPDDIAVLVRTGVEATRAQRELIEQGVPAVLSRGSVLDSPAADLHHLLADVDSGYMCVGAARHCDRDAGRAGGDVEDPHWIAGAGVPEQLAAPAPALPEGEDLSQQVIARREAPKQLHRELGLGAAHWHLMAHTTVTVIRYRRPR